MTNPWEGFIDRDAMLADFEAFCRQPPNFYNLTRSVDADKTYWALQTERAWQIWQAASRKMMEGV